MPSVSIIIVNWNGRHLLNDCLASVQKQTFTDFEIILVDNGSVDGSCEWVSRNFPEVQVISLDTNQGFCGGNNIGFRAARGDFIVLLNNDTEVEPRWLEDLYVQITADDRIAACDSKILYHDRRDTIWTSGGMYSIAGSVTARGFQKPDGIEFQQPAEVFSAVACSAIYRKSVVEEIGLFDEDFFAGYEDVDWSFRARLRGYRILNVPSSRVYHKVSATHIDNSDMFIYNGQRNVLKVFIKNMPPALLLRYWPLHLLYTVGSLIYFTRIGKGGICAKAKLSVLKQWKSLWKQRHQIQGLRTASSSGIDCLLDRKWLGSKAQKLIW